MQGFPDDHAVDDILWMQGDHVEFKTIIRKGAVMKRAVLFLVFGLVVWMASSALAQVEDTRCNGGVVQLGDSVVTVLEKCGDPTKRLGQGGFVTLYYAKQGGQGGKIFHIQNEKVDSMEELDD